MATSPAQIGVYFWDPSGRIGRVLDLASLKTRLAKAKNVVQVELDEAVDPLAGLFSIKNAFSQGKSDRWLLVGRFTAEMRRRMTKHLSQVGLNPFMLDWLDLEESGLLETVHDGGRRLQKADVLLKMSLARIRLLEPLTPVTIPGVETAVIIGGGVAGLHTAATLAGLGKKVLLIERESGLGGKTALLSRFYPLGCDPRCGLSLVVSKLAASDSVEIHTLSEIKSVSGQPGLFQIVMEKNPRFVSLDRCNACGECQKVCPVNLPASREYIQDVEPYPTDTGLLAMLGTVSQAIHPARPGPWPEALVIDRAHCPADCRACVQVCPTQAIDLNETPSQIGLEAGMILVTTGWDPYPLSRLAEYGYGQVPQVIGNLEMERLLKPDMDAPGMSRLDLGLLKKVGFIQCAGSRDERHLRYCSGVCCSATLKQVRRLKEMQPEIKIYIFYQDIRTPAFEEFLYQEVAAMNDVVFIRGQPSMVYADMAGEKVRVSAEDTFLGRQVTLDLDLLVLAGGLAPARGQEELAAKLGLPLNPSGFFEAHLQCHPEESRRTGIYVGGGCRQPMGVAAAIESAHHAAMTGLSYLDQEVTIQPTYPVVDTTRCDACGRCLEDCPFQAYSKDHGGLPFLNLSKCRQCGNCMGLCPLGAISLRHLTIKQMAAQINALGDSSAFLSEEPVILAFLCENDAYQAARSAATQGLRLPLNVVTLKVPCAGAVNNTVVGEALSQGIDGVLIGGCPESQCHYLKGSQLVRKRTGDLADKLEEMVIEPERVRFETIGIGEVKRYVDIIHEFVGILERLGPNPFKA